MQPMSIAANKNMSRMLSHYCVILRNQLWLQRDLTYSNLRTLSLSSAYVGIAFIRKWQRCSVDDMLKWIVEDFHLKQKGLAVQKQPMTSLWAL